MCLIIIKDGTENPKKEIIQNAADDNPDGLGILWLDTWEVEKCDSEDYKKLIGTSRDYIAHFRYATVGKVNKENTHPYPIDEDSVLFQNGTNKNLGNKKRSDTDHLANILRHIPEKLWADVLGITTSRYVTANLKEKNYTVHNIHKWIKDDAGNWYSKMYDARSYSYTKTSYSKSRSNLRLRRKNTNGSYNGTTSGSEQSSKSYLDYVDSYKEQHDSHGDGFIENDFLAVYGVLARGGHGHKLLSGCRLVGKGKTIQSYPIEEGLKNPYIVNSPGSGDGAIEVDIVSVPHESIMSVIDDYMGAPYIFRRRKVTVSLENGRLFPVWMFMLEEEDIEVSQLYNEAII